MVVMHDHGRGLVRCWRPGVKAHDALVRIAGPLTLLATLGLAGLYYTQGRHAHEAAARDRQIVECQSEFNIAVVENVRIRFELTGRALAASEELLTEAGKLSKPARGPAEEAAQARKYHNLFRAYARAVDARQEFAAANPLPAFPQCRVP